MRRSIAAVLALASAIAHADPPDAATLMPGLESIPLAGHIAVLADDTAAWTLDDARARDAQFVPSDDVSFNQGFTTKGAWWYRFSLRNPAAEPTQAVLQIDLPVLDYLDLHMVHEHSGIESILTGDLRQPPPVQLSVPSFTIPVRLAAAERATLYLRVATRGRHQVRLQLWSLRGYAETANRISAVSGAIQGILLMMALYNLIIFATIRERAYLYLAIWLVASFGSNAVLGGGARNLGNGLSPSAPALINACAPLVLWVVSACTLLFGREFLQLSRHAPRLNRITGYLLILTVAGGLLLPVIGWANSIRMGIPVVLLDFGALLLAGFHLAWQGVRVARFYLLACGVLFVSYIHFTLNVMAGPVPGMLAQFAPGAGLVVAVTLFSYALADRIRSERREKTLAAESETRLRGFLPRRVAELVGGGDKTLLEPKRRRVAVCVIDLRGFTPFSETAAPEEVMAVLRDFYDTMGCVVEQHDGTVEHFAGDSMLVFFNAPLEIAEPERQAVQTALEMRAVFEPLRDKWKRLGHELGLGIGIADGYATIGAIGFAGRSQYAAIGAVTNLASRLCSLAQHGEILTTARVLNAAGDTVEAESAGEQHVKGFSKPVAVMRVVGAKPPSAASRPAAATA
jgi:class 3 adenylate cyclase